MWKFEEYDVYMEMDVLRFEDKEGNILGYVSFGEPEDKNLFEKQLNEGADPIKDGWEDGIGNTLNINGWGKSEE